MKSQIRHVTDTQNNRYDALAFLCPGCIELNGSGLHMLPVNTTATTPSWHWDGNLELPTISPSILTRTGVDPNKNICHSFLKAGVFQFLGDCTHSLANQFVPMLDLPDWFIKESSDGN